MKFASHINRGKPLETAVLASQQLGVVALEKMPTGTKFLKGGERKLVASPVDFHGAIVATGRMIAFDAKTTALKTGWPIFGSLTPKQEQSIARWGHANAIAGVLVESTAIGAYFWLGWRDVQHIWLSGKCDGFRYVPWARMTELGDTKHLVKFDRIPGLREERA